MTDANSVSKGPTLAHAASTSTRGARYIAVWNRTIPVEEGARVERQQFSESAAGFLVFHEISFSFQCVLGHRSH